MAKTKAQKKEILDRLTEALAKTGNAVLVHFTQMTVADESAMRRSLREAGLSYFVAKKTLIRKALADNGMNAPELDGEVAVVYNTTNTDPTAPARLAHEFGEKFGTDRLSLLAGIFEEEIQNKEGIKEIATIPATPVLRGMFVNVINSPIQGLVIALNAVAEKKA